MSMDFIFFCLMVPLAMALTMLLSVQIGVGGCGWPSSIRVRVRRIGMENLAMRKRAATSASAADVVTFLMILAMTAMELLTRKPLELPRKMKPPARLRALLATR